MAQAADITSAPLGAGADVVLLGEIHDNPAHHLFQAETIETLRPSAVVFEMFGSEKAAGLKGIDLGEADAVSAALDWTESGWPEFAIYAPIFAAVDTASVFGGAVPRDEVRQAIGASAAEVFGEDAAAFGLDRSLPEDELAERLNGQMEAHCNALPVEMLPGMVEAQRLRDAGMARAAIEALDATGGPVVVITGNGHARRDWGVPVYLGFARADLKIVSVGQFEVQPDEDVPFDHWRVTDKVEREDPCAAFR